MNLESIRRSGMVLVVSLGLGAAVPLAAQSPSPVAPLEIRRAAGEITLDGALADAGWQGAATLDQFYENNPGDSQPAQVRTQVWFTYDDKYFYVAVEASDPEPAKIRAPFVDRDAVIGTDDNIALLLDTRNDRRTAYELRVNPRGIQGDALYNDATGNEDFSPDFFYDTAARITATGWNAEFRIPFSSLRYAGAEPITWGVLVWRNYPRDYRYGLHSAPIPRGSNCFICHAHPLTGFSGLPSSKHLIAAPYVTGQRVEQRDPGRPGADWDGESEFDAGLDVKWSPTANSAFDLTVNPDFSQIESDVAQIAANERFALFFPERRPFFLEGADLFDTPFAAAYTRSITQPRWGLRGTAKAGNTAYTLLLAEDRGGGFVILPGPSGSGGAPQDYSSKVAFGRARHELGNSFVGGLLTAREIDGGGHNRVLGPDFQWRPTEADRVTGQFLWSDTENPDRPDLSPAFNGRGQSGHAAHLRWSHNVRTHDWQVQVRDVADEFRADSGFVTAAGYRQSQVNTGLRFFPKKGPVSSLRTYATAEYLEFQDGGKLGHTFNLGAFADGWRNLQTFVEFEQQEVFAGGRRLEQQQVYFLFQVDPGRRWKRVALNGVFGEQVDFANVREGDGGTLTLSTTLHPTDHLQLEASGSRRFLDVDGGRLFTATVQRLRATYVFSARQLIRVIGEWVDTERDPALYTFPIPRRDGGFDGSFLYSFKLNWQTVLFLGYADQRIRLEEDALRPVGRSVFFKVSYAVQR